MTELELLEMKYDRDFELLWGMVRVQLVIDAVLVIIIVWLVLR